MSFAVFRYGSYVYNLYLFISDETFEFISRYVLEVVVLFPFACHHFYGKHAYKELEVISLDDICSFSK